MTFMISAKLLTEFCEAKIAEATEDKNRKRCECGCEEESYYVAQGKIDALHCVLAELRK